MNKRKRWAARPAVRLMGQGDKGARARTCTTVLVPLQRIFGSADTPVPQAAAATAEDASE